MRIIAYHFCSSFSTSITCRRKNAIWSSADPLDVSYDSYTTAVGPSRCFIASILVHRFLHVHSVEGAELPSSTAVRVCSALGTIHVEMHDRDGTIGDNLSVPTRHSFLYSTLLFTALRCEDERALKHVPFTCHSRGLGQPGFLRRIITAS